MSAQQTNVFQHVFLYQPCLHSLAIYGTTPESVSGLIHKLNDGLDYLILQSWLSVIRFDVGSQSFPVLSGLSTIVAVLLQAIVNLHVPQQVALFFAGLLTNHTNPHHALHMHCQPSSDRAPA